MESSNIGKRVIVRGDRSGLFFGTLERREGREVELTNVRRLWYWSGAASDFQLAAEGVKCPAECRFTQPIFSLEVLDAIEVLPCTEAAIANIEAVEIWKIG